MNDGVEALTLFGFGLEPRDFTADFHLLEELDEPLLDLEDEDDEDELDDDEERGRLDDEGR